jgi:pentatricopeptide repeat protein
MAVFDWMSSNQNKNETDSAIHESASYVTLFDLLVKARQWDKIDSIWNSISSSKFVPSILVFNTLINNCSLIGRTDQAMHWLGVTCGHGLFPSARTITFLMRSLCRDKNLDAALCVMEISEKAQIRCCASSYIVFFNNDHCISSYDFSYVYQIFNIYATICILFSTP